VEASNYPALIDIFFGDDIRSCTLFRHLREVKCPEVSATYASGGGN
jgi:hypothetical protein